MKKRVLVVDENKTIIQEIKTISILLIKEEEKHILRVIPVLLKQDVQFKESEEDYFCQ